MREKQMLDPQELPQGHLSVNVIPAKYFIKSYETLNDLLNNTFCPLNYTELYGRLRLCQIINGNEDSIESLKKAFL